MNIIKKWSGFLSDLPFNTASFGETYSGKEHTFLGSVYLNSNMIACVRWIHNKYKFPLYGEKSNWVLWVWISITKIGFTWFIRIDFVELIILFCHPDTKILIYLVIYHIFILNYVVFQLTHMYIIKELKTKMPIL